MPPHRNVRRLSPAGRWRFDLFFALLGGMGLLLLAISALVTDIDQRYRREGVQTTARVTGIRESYAGRFNSRVYEVGYSFDVNGQPVTGSQTLAAESYERAPLQPGVPVEIVYLASEPSLSQFASSLAAANPNTVTWAAVGLLGSAFIYTLIRQAVRRRR